MDVEKLIERLTTFTVRAGVAKCRPQICDDAAIALSVLKKKNDELRTELEGLEWRHNRSEQVSKAQNQQIDELEKKLDAAADRIRLVEQNQCRVDKWKLFQARESAISAYENANIFNTKAMRECIKPLLDEVSSILGIEEALHE